MTKAPRPPVGPSAHRLALMLAQVGALAAGRFAKRIAELDLTPAHANVLRVIATDPGRSHQSLSATAGMVPARLAVILDDLEKRGLIERRRHEQDQRLVALYLTASGQQFMGQLAAAGAEHERDITGALSDDERRALGSILEKLAQAHGMTTGPGFGYRGSTTGRSNGAATVQHPPQP
jgi:DNA-binding MarR family transcriptional regulator